MQGLYLYGEATLPHRHKKFSNRPASKVAVQRVIKAGDAQHVFIEATSMFGNEYDGPLVDAPDGTYTFVGPHPSEKRDFYGTIDKRGDTITVA